MDQWDEWSRQLLQCDMCVSISIYSDTKEYQVFMPRCCFAEKCERILLTESFDYDEKWKGSETWLNKTEEYSLEYSENWSELDHCFHEPSENETGGRTC